LSHLYGNEPYGNASSEFPFKDAILGKRFEDDEEVITEVKRWLDRDPQSGTAKAHRLSHLGGVRPKI
jgi:hypothetical protein